MRPKMIALLLAASALTLSGCSGLKNAMGMSKVSPDEFRIVTKAPLVLPPDYSLKPPAEGSKPDTSDAQDAAQAALVGDAPTLFTPTMTSGEKMLVAQAGAQYADPLIRQVVDQEFASLVDKNDDLTNRLVFWTANPSDIVTAQVNAPAEASKIAQGQVGAPPAAQIPAPPPPINVNAAVPDQIQGQQAPTIGKEHSHLLDGIF